MNMVMMRTMKEIGVKRFLKINQMKTVTMMLMEMMARGKRYIINKTTANGWWMKDTCMDQVLMSKQEQLRFMREV